MGSLERGSDRRANGGDGVVIRACSASNLEEERSALLRLARRYSALQARQARLQRYLTDPNRYDAFLKWSKTDAKGRKLSQELHDEVRSRASSEVRDDEEVMLAVVVASPWLFDRCSRRLRSNKEVALASLTENFSCCFDRAGRTLRRKRSFILQALQKNVGALLHASRHLRNDLMVVRRAVKKDGTALRHAGRALRDRRYVVNKALKQNGLALGYASRRLRGKSRIVLRAVEQSGMALEFANEELRSQEFMAIAAVSRDGLALQFASLALRNDRNVVLTAVKQKGEALEFASSALRGDKEVVFCALANCPWALQHASSDLRGNVEIVVAALRSQSELGTVVDPDVLLWASDELRSNREVILQAARFQRMGTTSLAWASPELRKDQDFVLEAMRASSSDDYMYRYVLAQADESLHQLPFDLFEGAFSSKLASRGEAAPVLTISLASPSPWVSAPPPLATMPTTPDAIQSCEVTLMSGATFSCSLLFNFFAVFPLSEPPWVGSALTSADAFLKQSDPGEADAISSDSDSEDLSDDDNTRLARTLAATVQNDIQQMRERTRRLQNETRRLQQQLMEHVNSQLRNSSQGQQQQQPQQQPQQQLQQQQQQQQPEEKQEPSVSWQNWKPPRNLFRLAFTVDELSHVVSMELEKHLQAWPLPKRVSIIFRKADGSSVAVTPWDWKRPLTDFA